MCVLESDDPRQAEWEPNAEEKALLREEFLSQMHQRFLDGKDDFNYRSNHSACSHRSQILNIKYEYCITRMYFSSNQLLLFIELLRADCPYFSSYIILILKY